MQIIKQDRSIIPACDVPVGIFKEIVEDTANLEKVGGYKIGVSFLHIGLRAVVELAREYTDKPIIYDHQKAGTDIHESTPDRFMDSMARAGVDAIILFPLSGPVTQYEWTKAAQDRGIGVIIGGMMTHPRFLETDCSNSKKKDYVEVFEGLGYVNGRLRGYIRKDAPVEIYRLAAAMGVTDFVVPGNKPAALRRYKEVIMDNKISKPVFYAPGLVAQGGDITEGAKAAGERFHAIVGRGIYAAGNIRQAALELTSKL